MRIINAQNDAISISESILLNFSLGLIAFVFGLIVLFFIIHRLSWLSVKQKVILLILQFFISFVVSYVFLFLPWKIADMHYIGDFFLPWILSEVISIVLTICVLYVIRFKQYIQGWLRSNLTPPYYQSMKKAKATIIRVLIYLSIILVLTLAVFTARFVIFSDSLRLESSFNNYICILFPLGTLLVLFLWPVIKIEQLKWISSLISIVCFFILLLLNMPAILFFHPLLIKHEYLSLLGSIASLIIPLIGLLLSIRLFQMCDTVIRKNKT